MPQTSIRRRGVFAVIRDAEVAAWPCFLDVVRVDGDDDFDVVDEALKQGFLESRLELRAARGGVVVVEKLAAELEG